MKNLIKEIIKKINFKVMCFLTNKDYINDINSFMSSNFVRMKFYRFLNLYSLKTKERQHVDYYIIPKISDYILEKTINNDIDKIKKEVIVLIGFRRYVAHYIPYYLNNQLYVIDPTLNKLPCDNQKLFWYKDYFENVYGKFKSKKIKLISFIGVYGWGIDDEKSLGNILNLFYEIMDESTLLLFCHNINDHNPLNIYNSDKKYFNKFVEIKIFDINNKVNSNCMLFQKRI